MKTSSNHVSYSFRTVKNQLKHQPRTQNDLAKQEQFKRAEGAAQDLTNEAFNTYNDLMLLDQSDFDHNGRDGEVLLKDYKYKDGSTVSGILRKNVPDAWPAETVLDVEKTIDSETAELKLKLDHSNPDPYSLITRNSGGVSEMLAKGSYVRDGISEYEVAAQPDASSPLATLATSPYQPDAFPSMGPRSSDRFADLEINDQNGKLEYQPRTLEDLEKTESLRAVAQAGNTAVETVQAVLDGFLKLDGTKSDLNPRKGEVLLENQSIAGRTVSGYLAEFQVRDGNTEEREIHGTFPYLQAFSTDSNETFQAYLTENSDYNIYEHQVLDSYSSSLATYRHDDGEQAVHVVLNDTRGSVRIETAEAAARKAAEAEANKSWWRKIFG
ncbi:MAG: hypothetical protein KC800_11065 [Candidatus Eremiobacteraeota bacterium]|nr:hypothetical protein [Candidatus Eremiobacteraeota bacterium]